MQKQQEVQESGEAFDVLHGFFRPRVVRRDMFRIEREHVGDRYLSGITFSPAGGGLVSGSSA